MENYDYQAEHEQQIIMLEQDRHNALVACRNLAQNDPKKRVRTAAKIMVAQLEKANSEVHNGHQGTQQAAISF